MTSMMKMTQKTIIQLILLIISGIYIVPVWLVLVNSLKVTDEANKYYISLPAKFEFINYKLVIETGNVIRSFFNGLFIAVVVGVIAVIFAAIAAFYIARVSNGFSRFAYNYFISGLIIPIAIVPTYFALLIMQLNNTYLGLILVFVAYTMPLSIFLYTGFIKTIPTEIDEAAIIDGCSGLNVFARVIFPLLAPVTTTVIVFNFIGVWNDVPTFLYFAGGDKWSLPMTVYLFFGKYNQSWNLVFADIIITIIPCLLIYLFGQKYVVSGMTAGAVKG